MPHESVIRAFLERHLDGSIFLLSCLDQFGPAAGTHPNSGTYRTIERDGDVAAVFSLTRRGHMLVQAAGDTSLGSKMLEGCRDDGIRITGVLGDWAGALSVWRALGARTDFSPAYESRLLVYGLDLVDARLPSAGSVNVRLLRNDDFDRWDTLTSEFIREERVPDFRDHDTQRESFARRTARKYWWGAFDGDELIATAAIDETYRAVALIGGLYTRPAWRGRGFGRSVMTTLLREIGPAHHVARVVLCVSEHNTGACALYEQFGFRPSGDFGMCFGEYRQR